MKRKIKLITCEGCGANTEYFAIVDNKKLCAKCEQRTKSKNQRIIELCNQIDKLEQQLEEKDKEIARYKQELEQTNAGYDFIYEQSGKTINELKQLAIDELEKVKEFICDYSEITGQVWNHTLRFLNNQIKELKGE